MFGIKKKFVGPDGGQAAAALVRCGGTAARRLHPDARASRPPAPTPPTPPSPGASRVFLLLLPEPPPLALLLHSHARLSACPAAVFSLLNYIVLQHSSIHFNSSFLEVADNAWLK